MRDLLILVVPLLTTVATLLGPGGATAVAADSLLVKQQLLVIHRSRSRAPNLSALDRIPSSPASSRQSPAIDPGEMSRGAEDAQVLERSNYRGQAHCRGLYQLPVAA